MTEASYTPRRRRPRRRARPGPRVLPVLLAGIVVLAGAKVCRMVTRGPDGEGVAVPDYVEEDLLPVNQWSRPGITLERIEGVVIHYVGNPDTTAQANRNYFSSLSSGEEETYASSHFIVGLEGEVVQCIPLTEQAYATPGRNADTVAVEVCHPDETGEFSPVTYDRAVELTAWLCGTFGLDPETDVTRHYDATGKRCPLYYVEHPEAWEAFLADTAEALEVLRAREAS